MKISENLEVYEHRTRRRLVRTGGSLSITLPLEWLKAQKLKKGSEVLTVFDDAKGPLKILAIISKQEKRRREKGMIQVKTHLTKKQVENIIKKFEKADKKTSTPDKQKVASKKEGSVSPAAKQRDTGRLTQRREDAGEQE